MVRVAIVESHPGLHLQRFRVAFGPMAGSDVAAKGKQDEADMLKRDVMDKDLGASPRLSSRRQVRFVCMALSAQ